MTTKSIGDKAEKRAAEYLLEHGYEILANNYRFRRAEIDLVVKKDEIITFVEVKYRADDSFGHPESFVDDRKAELVGLAATHFCESSKWLGRIQFDIIAITDETLQHFKDAFN